MHRTEDQDHHLIAIYGETDKQDISTLLSNILPEKDIRVLTPQNEEALLQAAQNSSLVIIVLKNEQDRNIYQANVLKEDRKVVADIMAIVIDADTPNSMKIMAKRKTKEAKMFRIWLIFVEFQ